MVIREMGMKAVIIPPTKTPYDTIVANPSVAPIATLYDFSYSKERLNTMI